MMNKLKILINPLQYKILESKIKGEVKEQGETGTPSPQPTAGTSSTQSGGQGYPQVGKWESGVTRGPSNQIGTTKWSDIVGSVLKRGKANPLK